jgi:predicted lipid-binding transport protein (Tim44 family)
VQWLFIGEFGQMAGARYSAFLQNLLMSGLFIAMLVARRGIRGQTLTIAISKWIGTLAPTILIGVLGNMPFITAIGIMCSVFDLIYIGLVWRARKHPEAFADAAPAAPELGAATAAAATPAA